MKINDNDKPTNENLYKMCQKIITYDTQAPSVRCAV